MLYLQEKEELIKSQEDILQERKNEVVPNVANLLFSRESDGRMTAQDELLDALDSKYDALREKLLIEALIKEVITCSCYSKNNSFTRCMGISKSCT